MYVHFMNHTFAFLRDDRTYAYLRDDRKINFSMVSAQHFINEALWCLFKKKKKKNPPICGALCHSYSYAALNVFAGKL